jgi:hypothetical protein
VEGNPRLLTDNDQSGAGPLNANCKMQDGETASVILTFSFYILHFTFPRADLRLAPAAN